MKNNKNTLLILWEEKKMTEIALEKMRTAVNKYREESGISIKTLAFALDGIS